MLQLAEFLKIKRYTQNDKPTFIILKYKIAIIKTYSNIFMTKNILFSMMIKTMTFIPFVALVGIIYQKIIKIKI